MRDRLPAVNNPDDLVTHPYYEVFSAALKRLHTYRVANLKAKF